jgi:cytochrome c-type biogenesis protein CcmE
MVRIPPAGSQQRTRSPKNSWITDAISTRTRGAVTDIAVVYHGILPDLFREGQSVVAGKGCSQTERSKPRLFSPNMTSGTCRAKSLRR